MSMFLGLNESRNNQLNSYLRKPEKSDITNRNECFFPLNSFVAHHLNESTVILWQQNKLVAT